MSKFQFSIFHSRILHGVLILSFTLPFFYTGCERIPFQEETKIEADMPADNSEIVDTTVVEPTTTLTNESDTTYAKQQVGNQYNEDETLSRQLANKARIWKMLLEPDEYRYTGLGAVANTLPYYDCFSIFNAFLFVFISLLFKLLNPLLSIQTWILEFLALIFLFSAQFWGWNNEILFGYWTAFTLLLSIIVLDGFLIYYLKKRNCTN